MPRTGKRGSGSSTGSKSTYKDIGKILAANKAASAPQGDDDPGHSGPSYSAGFGTRDGGFCHCARCLRRSGPLTDDPGRVAEDIMAFLDDVDPDGMVTNCADSSPEELDEHHRLIAETTSLAVERGDQAVLKAILDSLLDNSVQCELATLLAIPVAQHGHANLVYLLDEYGADWEETDSSRGGPALMHAANNGHSYAVNALLECGADTEAVDFNGQTALMVAIFSDRAGAAEALLSGGSLVDNIDDKGRTALCHAARYGSLDCISVLAQHNADVCHVDNDGSAPLDIAEECSRTEAAAQIRRLLQRQRLRERREARLREAELGVAVSEADLLRREDEARRNAEALLAEVETEALRKAAKKPKAKKEKRRGKVNCEDAKAAARVADAAESSSSHQNGRMHAAVQPSSANGRENGRINGHVANGHSHRKQASSAEPSNANGDVLESRQYARRKQQHMAEADGSRQPGHQPTSSAASDDTTFSPARAQSGGRASQDGRAEKRQSEDAASPPPDPLALLRQEWDDLLEEAASCKSVTRQAELIAQVQGMAERCTTAGISVKYGKKVLGKLERVGRVREALTAALEAEPADRERLADTMDQARTLRSLMEPQLLSRTEELLERLNKVEEERRAAAQAAEPIELSPTAAPSEEQASGPHAAALIEHTPSKGCPPNRLAENGQQGGLEHILAGSARKREQSGEQVLGMDLFEALFPQEQQMHNQGLELSWQQSPSPQLQPPAASFFGSSLFASLPSASGGGQLPQHGLARDPVLATDSNPLLRRVDRVVGPRPYMSHGPHGPPPPHWQYPGAAAGRPYLPPSSPSMDHLLHGLAGSHANGQAGVHANGRAKREHRAPPVPPAALNGFPAEPWQAMRQPPAYDPARQHALYDRRPPSFEEGRQRRSFDGRATRKAPVTNGRAAPTWEVPEARLLDADTECVVCMAVVKDFCCVPCGHVCMCGSCSSAIMQQSGLCPICRTGIEQVIQIPC